MNAGIMAEQGYSVDASENYEWLGGKDSNLDKQIQSLPSYRWTTPHQK